MRISTTASRLALAFALVVFTATTALSQPLPSENHYKVYNSTAFTRIDSLNLRDQFGKMVVNDLVFDKFATPTEKILSDGTVYPILRPDIHMDWWRIQVPQPTRTIIVTDQFGQKAWEVGNAAYLLLPALKYVPVGTPAPTYNHYLCYEVVAGPIYSIPLTLIDQFGTAPVLLLSAKYFCNPVEKTTGDGQVFPILDFNAHLAVYSVENSIVDPRSVTTVDQFGYWQTQIFENILMCAPALKDYDLPTERSTWGRIKSLYRD